MQRIFRLPMSQRSSFIFKAAAEISERTSASEQTVVRKAFELSKGRTGRRALVGCSLLAEGKPELIRALRAEKND